MIVTSTAYFKSSCLKSNFFPGLLLTKSLTCTPHQPGPRGARSEDRVARLVDSTGRAAAEAEEMKDARLAMEVREVENFIVVMVIFLNRWNLGER